MKGDAAVVSPIKPEAQQAMTPGLGKGADRAVKWHGRGGLGFC